MNEKKPVNSEVYVHPKLSCKNEGEIKISDKQKVRKFVTSGPSLQETIKGCSSKQREFIHQKET